MLPKLQLHFILLNRKALSEILKAAMYFQWALSQVEGIHYCIKWKMWRKHKKRSEIQGSNFSWLCQIIVTSPEETVLEPRSSGKLTVINKTSIK